MSFAHKVVLWVMQRRGYLVRLNKRQNFFHTLLFCSKGRTIRKVKGGGGEFSSRRNIFSLSDSLYEFFLGHSMNIF